MLARSIALRSLTTAFAALALSAAPSFAQDLAPASAKVSVVAAPSPLSAPAAVAADATSDTRGPSLDAATVAVRRVADAPAAPQPALSISTGEKWMILGGAAILTGIVVGGDAGHAISIGGAVVGLYGLYQYLQ